MNKSNFRRRLSAPPCAELHEDDGIDPRFIRKKRYNEKKHNFQNIRLCKQIERALSLLFAGGSGDERLTGIGVESVKPAPNMSCLMVTVFPVFRDPEPDPDMLIFSLESAKKHLRYEVAAEIRRKRMPDFRFRVIVDPEKFIN